MKISVIIVGYKGDPWLPKCIQSIRPHTDHDIELLIVDNFENDCLQSLDFGDLAHRIITPPKVCGFAEANNFAFVNGGCESDAVVLLNQDTWSESAWIPHCADILEQNDTLGALSPTVRQYDADDFDPNFATCLRDDAVTAGDAAFQRVNKMPAVALMIRTSTLLKAGPFDPIYGSYYEDYDLCHRLLQTGQAIGFANGAWVRHFSGSASTTPAAKYKRTVQVLRNRLIYQLRISSKPRWGRLLTHFLVSFPRNIIRSLIRTPSSHPLAAVLRANLEITGLLGRIITPARDHRAWESYLADIEWHQLRYSPSSPTAKN